MAAEGLDPRRIGREPGSLPDGARPFAAAAALDPEWARIGELIFLSEAKRTGAAVDDDFAERFEEVAEAVRAAREGGSWAGLAREVDAEGREDFVQLDLDMMAVALAPDARPSLAPRIQALQPQVAAPWPSIALVQELLMLEAGDDTAALYDRLSAHAPLLREALVRIEGVGPYQVLHATPKLVRLTLGRSTELGPPPGALLETRRGRWSDLIVPLRTMQMLRDLCAWARHGPGLVDTVGRSAIGGPLALFTGASGVGKSFAARVVAGELAAATGEPWSLYTVDLGRIMSKYVGETEQNINALLNGMEGRRAILQIDEADGLLGRRGDISDARDNFANVMVSHLLARLERHRGPVILTTNLRSNIDAAFLRRFQLVVEFTMPDEAQRTLIWDRLLPVELRAAELSSELLARSVQLSPGSILNAAVYASVLAAEEGGPVRRRHVARAVWAELGKENRQVRRTEIGGLADCIEGEGT